MPILKKTMRFSKTKDKYPDQNILIQHNIHLSKRKYT